jgi:decaprenylphospho-beta-D-ribofuranose 2-oxidase
LTEPAQLAGWGRTPVSAAQVARPRHADEVAVAVKAGAERGAIARGLGRSYGDAAQCAGGAVLDCTDLGGGAIAVDASSATVTVAAGTSIETLLRVLVTGGWFVPVTPGTRHVTVGGAIAADVHGKNHHRDGSICRHVTSLTMWTPADGVVTVGPDDPLFWATAGGMGLTGVVLEATLRLLPIETASMRVATERVPDLDSAMDLMTAEDDQFRYSVAWIDLLARGKAMGRSVLTRADHAAADDVADAPRPYTPRARIAVPPWVPDGLLNRVSIRAFNELWFRRAPARRRDDLQSISAFFHPLDAVVGWNRLYGTPGFLQYQFVVPFGEEPAVRTAVELLSASRCPSFLAILKRFGPGTPGPLSFPMPGWTLAVDIPAAVPGLPRLLDRLDDVVLDAGGRLYLAKDARMRPALLPRMYPRLDEWRAVRERVDPDRVLQSDLSRRLGL